jgi:hypothetical protein
LWVSFSLQLPTELHWSFVLTCIPLKMLRSVTGLPSLSSAQSLMASPSAFAVSAVCWHESLVPLHASVVHGSLSLAHAVPFTRRAFDGHAADVPEHISGTSHSPFDGRHSTPADVRRSTGQASDTPSQLSEGSQGPPETRQETPGRIFASSGQAPADPVQVSATSQMPIATRQMVELDLNASLGHAALVPLQVSVRSHVPTAARQTVPPAANPSDGHDVDEPLQTSATSHGSKAARQVVPLGSTPLGGHVAVPSHVSGTSQAPLATRQTLPTLPAGCVHEPLPLQVSVVQALPSSAHAVPLGLFASIGHAADDPSHVSAASQASVAARQTVPELPAG